MAPLVQRGLQDAYHAYYARLFTKDHPEFEGFFTTSSEVHRTCVICLITWMTRFDLEYLDLDDYQEQADEFCFYPGTMIYPALGLTSEAGEVADKIKKLLRDDEMPLSEDFSALDIAPDKANSNCLRTR